MKMLPLISVLVSCLLVSSWSTIQATPENQIHTTSSAMQDKTDATGLRHAYDTCLDASGGADAAMQDCISAEYVYQDARLNKIYKSLMVKIPKDEQARLRDEERKWIAYRDAHCKLAPDSGQGQRLESNDCAVEQTAKRATVLEGRQH
jgi:uncharacterized protein YecT (DUF1311 family)